jgi:hypothetical protein
MQSLDFENKKVMNIKGGLGGRISRNGRGNSEGGGRICLKYVVYTMKRSQ